MSEIIDGKGGGKAESAQATGKNPSKLKEAMAVAVAYAQKFLGSGDAGALTPLMPTLFVTGGGGLWEKEDYASLFKCLGARVKVEGGVVGDGAPGGVSLSLSGVVIRGLLAAAFAVADQSLLPQSPPSLLASVLQWSFYATGDLAHVVNAFVWCSSSEENGDDKFGKAQRALREAVDGLNAVLSRQRCLSCGEVTLADKLCAWVLEPVARFAARLCTLHPVEPCCSFHFPHGMV